MFVTFYSCSVLFLFSPDLTRDRPAADVDFQGSLRGSSVSSRALWQAQLLAFSHNCWLVYLYLRTINSNSSSLTITRFSSVFILVQKKYSNWTPRFFEAILIWARSRIVMFAMFVSPQETESALQTSDQLLIVYQRIACSPHIYKVLLRRRHNHPKFQKS